MVVLLQREQCLCASPEDHVVVLRVCLGRPWQPEAKHNRDKRKVLHE